MKSTEIKIVDGLLGTLTLPDNLIEHEKLPAVLLVHGYGTDRNEVANVYEKLATILAEKNIASLRIDLRGFGKSIYSDSNLSGLPIENMTVDTVVQDVVASVGYLVNNPIFDNNRIGICGYSLGGAVTCLAIEKMQQQPTQPQIKAVSLIAPVGDFKSDFLKVFNISEREFEEILTGDQIYTFDLGWRVVKVKPDLFKSFVSHAPKKAITQYNGAFFAIAGSNDPIVGDHAKEYVSQCPSTNKDYLLIDGADHVFNVFDDTRSSMDTVIERTSNWLGKNL